MLVINAMGLIFMPELGCPFRAVERELEACGLKKGADAILVDFHAEATSEKQAMGYFVDGRASCVVGTHTHCAHRRRARAAARHRLHVAISACAATTNSVLGMDPERAAQPLPHQDPARTIRAGHAARPRISGLAVDIDDATGLARRTTGLRLGGVLTPTEPLFWVE